MFSELLAGRSRLPYRAYPVSCSLQITGVLGCTALLIPGRYRLPDTGRSRFPDTDRPRLPNTGRSRFPDTDRPRLPDTGRSRLPDTGRFRLPDTGRSRSLTPHSLPVSFPNHNPLNFNYRIRPGRQRHSPPGVPTDLKIFSWKFLEIPYRKPFPDEPSVS